MVLEYLSPSFCYDHDGKPDLEPDRPLKPSPKYADPTSSRKHPTSSRLSLLSPVSQILKTSAELVNSAVHHLRDGLTEDERIALRKVEERKQILHLRLKNATAVQDWKAAARELDDLEGHKAWKTDPESDDYDYELIAARLAQLDDARISCDVSRMLYLVRTALSRDLGGMGNIRLYKHSHVGTKDLIERYIDSTLETIRKLVEMSEKSLPDGIDSKEIMDQVVYARQAFGRTGLLLSGGATFGMNHIGVLKALFEANLLPRIISGASAGSIVCAVLCTRTDEEIPDMLKKFPYGDLAVFEDAAREDGILERVGRFLTHGAWIDIQHLVRVMQELLGNMTFQEAYNRTRRILNICVSSASIYELPRLLNYVTSPNVMIWSAVAASCSVPLLFSAAELLVKNPLTGEHVQWNPTPQRWIDGSVDNDLPMTRLAEMFNVNHFIVSQVNPHVVPFLAKDDATITAASNASPASAAASDWAFTLTSLARNEAVHRMQILADLGIFPNLVTKARSVLSQKYSGDITILPEINYRDFPRILKNPTSEFMLNACLCGERATWPKLSRIRNHCSVELELDAAVQRLRARVVFSPSQVDLRRMSEINGLSMGRRRRVSGSNVLSMARADEDSDERDLTFFANSRPPLRTTSSAVVAAQTTTMSQPTPTNPIMGPLKDPRSSTPPNPRSQNELSYITEPPFYSTRTLAFHKSLVDVASETDHSRTHDMADFASSDADADIDSHTDESSPEPDFETYTRSNSRSNSGTPGRSRSGTATGLRGERETNLFLLSQPPGMSSYHSSLALNATMPPSAFSPSIPSPTAVRDRDMDREVGGILSSGALGMGTGMASPELNMTRDRISCNFLLDGEMKEFVHLSTGWVE
jgi:TAG lipase/steryl ester hydrolase/phospholipase A2/LPA acyltransferase